MSALQQHWGSINVGGGSRANISVRDLIEAERSDSRIFVKSLRSPAKSPTDPAEGYNPGSQSDADLEAIEINER